MNDAELQELIESGDIEECLVCGELSAYAFEYVTNQEQFQVRNSAKPGEIGHIGAASGWEWECGHCGVHHVQRDAPILAECYTTRTTTTRRSEHGHGK